MSFQDTWDVEVIPLVRQRLLFGGFTDKCRVREEDHVSGSFNRVRECLVRLSTRPCIAAIWETNAQVLVSEQNVIRNQFGLPRLR